MVINYKDYNAHGVNCRRSNFLGTSFTVFDGGVNPQNGRTVMRGFSVREELAAVHYVRMVE